MNRTATSTQRHISLVDVSPTEKGEIEKLLQKRKAYWAARDIVTALRVFLEMLQTICIEFRKAIQETSSSHQKSIISYENIDSILGVLPSFMLLLKSRILANVERRLATESNFTIADIFIQNWRILKLHLTLDQEITTQIYRLDKCIRNYPRFRKALRQFEQLKGNTLKNMMNALQPFQQFNRYRLLLRIYLNYLDESTDEYQAMNRVLEAMTSAFILEINSRKEEGLNKLIWLQSRFIGRQEIFKEGRHLIKEGTLYKVCRNTLKIRYLILTNDCLICASFILNQKISSSNRLKLHYILPLHQTEVRFPVRMPIPSSITTNTESSIFNLDFDLITTKRSFTLYATSKSLRDEWMKAITFAIKQLKNKQSSTTLPAVDNGAASITFRFGQKAPVWAPDQSSTKCQQCAATFRPTFRRHHCRACGKVVCRYCSSHTAKLEYQKLKPAVRVCDYCFLCSIASV